MSSKNPRNEKAKKGWKTENRKGKLNNKTVATTGWEKKIKVKRQGFKGRGRKFGGKRP